MQTASERSQLAGLALVVGDDPTSLLILLRFLQHFRILSHVAENGAQCLDLCENFVYDLIFVDSILPDLNASEVVRRLRRQGLNRVAPLIGLSAGNAPISRQAMADAGCNAFVLKPLERGQVGEIVTQWGPGRPEEIH